MLGHQCYGVKEKKHYQHLNTNLSQALLLFWGLVIQTVNQFISSGPKRSYSARDICYLCHGLEVFLDNLQGSGVDDWGEDIAQTHTPWAAFLIPWILFFPYKSLYVRKDLKTIYWDSAFSDTTVAFLKWPTSWFKAEKPVFSSFCSSPIGLVILELERGPISAWERCPHCIPRERHKLWTEDLHQQKDVGLAAHFSHALYCLPLPAGRIPHSEAFPTQQPRVLSLPNTMWRQAAPLLVHGAIFGCRRTDCNSF